MGPGDGGRTGHRRASKSDDGALLEEETYFPSVEHRANNEHSGLSSLFARTKAIFSVLRSVDWSPRDFFLPGHQFGCGASSVLAIRLRRSPRTTFRGHLIRKVEAHTAFRLVITQGGAAADLRSRRDPRGTVHAHAHADQQTGASPRSHRTRTWRIDGASSQRPSFHSARPFARPSSPPPSFHCAHRFYF